MVLTAKEILFSRIFPGQIIQDLKVINQDICEKAYHINLMYDRLLTFLWYSFTFTPSNCLIHQLFSKTDIGYQDEFHRQYLFPGYIQIFSNSRTFPSKTWKKNLLFSRFSRRCGNPELADMYHGLEYIQ